MSLLRKNRRPRVWLCFLCKSVFASEGTRDIGDIVDVHVSLCEDCSFPLVVRYIVIDMPHGLQ